MEFKLHAVGSLTAVMLNFDYLKQKVTSLKAHFTTKPGEL